MRGRFLVAVLGVAGILVLAAGLLVWSGSDDQPETAASSIVVDIQDNPASVPADDAQDDAEAVAAASEPPEATPEPVEDAAPAVPEKLLIADAIRAKLADPGLRQGAHPDDLAALDAFFAQYSGPARWLTSAGLTPQAKSIVAEIGKANDWGLDADSFTLPPADYVPTVADDQAVVEIVLDMAVLQYARAARGGRTDPSTVSKLFEQKPPLREPGMVLTEIAATDTPDAYLRGLHPKHPQFEALRQALLKVRAQGGDADAETILVNMERWRWMPEDLGAFYVWLNVPAFTVEVVKDGKTVETENAVVGSPTSPTPILSADLKTIVFNPERVVPLSVIRKDVLPKMKSRGWLGGTNTEVLDKYQLTVKNRGKTVDPDSIDWDKVNLSALTFVQAPGPTNFLGKVQFLYPNSQNVFMHDTIIRSQLTKAVRAEGAKEPRVGNPDDLAATVLAEDKGWNAAKVKGLVASGKNTEVAVDKQIPVHTTYFTAVVDDQGAVKTFDDVYKLDGALGEEILGKVSAPPVKETEAAAPPPARKPVGENLATTAR